MELLRKNILTKLKKKNIGNSKLVKEINKLIIDIEEAEWEQHSDIKFTRSDADCVHNDGFYFFDIHIHRTMVWIVFEDDLATILWAGSHQEYEETFKNNKDTIEKFLKNKRWI